MSDRRAESKARLAIGQRCFKLTADEIDLVELLIHAGHLPPNNLRNPTLAEIELALTDLIVRLIDVHKAELDGAEDTSQHGPLKFGKPVTERNTTERR